MNKPIVLPDAQELQALFNSTIGIVITDSEGNIINFNPFAEKLFGYHKEEILGMAVEVLIPTNYSRHKTYRDAFIEHPQKRVMGAGRELFALRKDKSSFPVEISLNHYRLEDKNFVIAFVIDITVRKTSEALVLKQMEKLEVITAQISQMNFELEKKVEDRTKMLRETFVELEKSQEELRSALEKEKELGELKSRFVAMASHEFRTPLSTIQTSAYIIQQYTTTDDQEKRDKHLVKIQNAVQVLNFILEDFLSLEKLEKGYVQATLQLTTKEDLVTEIESVLDEMGQVLKKGQAFQFTPIKMTNIITDKKLLRNILLNLISNAIKYSGEQSVITISTDVENNYFRISVSDQGIGIPEAEQKHLFERFFRATNAATIQGTGLGLHIVNRYLKLIDGNIEMNSELNKGTTFTIALDASVIS
jgi:PAS domain S-box-containing protein